MVREKALAKDYKPFLICFREYIMTDNLSQAQMLSSLSVVSNFETPLTAAHQGSLSFTISWGLLKCMPIESVIPSNDPLLSPSPLAFIFPSIRAFFNELVLLIKRPKYCRFSFNIRPSSEYSELISFRMDWLDLLQSKGLSRVFSNTTVQKHQFFGAQTFLWPSSHILHNYWRNHSFD